MNAITKKVVAVMAAVVMAVTAAVSVSADYANVDKYGFYYTSSNKIVQINLGESIPLSNPYSVRWALSGLQPNYTYDIFFDIIFDGAVDKSVICFLDRSVYYSVSNSSLNGFIAINSSSAEGWTAIDKMNGTIEYISDKHLTIHLFYNYDMLGLNYSTIQFALQMYSYNGGFNSVKAISQGVGAYYDPGGDTYSQLIYEYGSGNQLPDVKDIKDKGSAMSKAEAAVRDKSDDLVASVESDWSAMQSTAKAGVTSLQPAAATVNSAFGLVMDELPDEVKILFVAIPILLFIGWLIGRVRE